jgi:hypothetical protein
MSGSSSSVPGAGHTTGDTPSPAEPVSLTVHSLPQLDAQDLERRTRQGRWKMLLVLAMCAAPVVASYVTYYVIRPQGRTNYGELILPTRSLPGQLPLKTLAGDAVDPASLRRQWLLVTVTGSVCDTACEARLLMMRQLHLMMGKDRDRLEKIWIVTDEGSPDARLLAAQSAGAEPVRVLRVAREALGLWLAPGPGHALEDHLYIIDPMGEWMMRAPPRPEPQRIKRDLERLLRASASWDTAGR